MPKWLYLLEDTIPFCTSLESISVGLQQTVLCDYQVYILKEEFFLKSNISKFLIKKVGSFYTVILTLTSYSLIFFALILISYTTKDPINYKLISHAI